MAEDTNTVINIVDLEINQEQALDNLSELEQQIIANKKATADLKKEQKNLEDQGKKNSAQYEQNAKQITLNNAQLKQRTKEFGVQQRAVNDLLQTEQRELGTLEKLTLANKQLREEQRKLNLETEEGKARNIEIINEIDKNSQAITENSDAYIRQKRNVGNYEEAIENAITPTERIASAVGQVSASAAEAIPAVGGFTNRIKGMTAAAKAFLLSPIGLVIGAIAATLGLLAKGLQRSQLLLDKFRIAGEKLAAVFDVIIDRISNGLENAFKRLREEPVQALKDLGTAIVTNIVNRFTALPKLVTAAVGAALGAVEKLIRGTDENLNRSLKNLDEALTQVVTGLDPEQQKKAAAGFKELGAEIKADAAAAKELAQAEIDLRDLEIELIGRTAELTREREKAKLATRDDTLSIEERLAAQDKAIKLDEQILQAELTAAKERARISQERIDLGKSTREDLEENARIQAEVINLETQFFTRQKELQSERLSLSNQLKAEEQARVDAAAQALEEEASNLQAFIEREVEIFKLRNKSLIDDADILTEELIANETERINAIADKQEAAAQSAYDKGLINAQELELATLQIQADANSQKLALEQEFQDQKLELEEQNAIRLFELQQQELSLQLGSEFEIRRNALTAWYEEQLTLAVGNQETLTQLESTYSALRKQINREEINSKVSAYKTGLQAIQGAVQENTIAYKAATTAIIAIDTYKSAIAAFSALAGIPYVGPVLGGIAAAAATAAGVTAIRNVWAVDEKGGARSVSSPTSGSTSTGSASIPEASISSSGGVVERNLDQQVATNDTIVEEVPVQVVDDITAAQKNLKQNETLATV